MPAYSRVGKYAKKLIYNKVISLHNEEFRLEPTGDISIKFWYSRSGIYNKKNLYISQGFYPL